MKTALVATVVLSALLAVIPDPLPAATPTHFWSLRAGDAQNDAINVVAVIPGSGGEVVVTGRYMGTLDLGFIDPELGNANSGFVARFTNRGELRWIKSIGDTGNDNGTGVTVDAAGFIYLIGTTNYTVNLGGADLYSAGGTDFYVAKLDGNGGHVWSQIHGGTGEENATGISVDASGNVIVSGSFNGTTNLGGVAGIPGSGVDCYIVKYNSSGTWQWNAIGGDTGNTTGYGIAVDAAGNIYQTGYFDGALNFGGGFPTQNSAGGLDIFLIKLNSAGTIQWLQRRGGVNQDLGVAIAADASGNIVVTGGFGGTLNLGGSDLTSVGGSFDIFLARYNTSGGHLWSQRFGGLGTDIGQSLTLLDSGSILLGGYGGSGVNLGGGILPSTGTNDFLFGKFSSSGAHSWSRMMGGQGDDRLASIAADAAGNAIVAGSFEGHFNPGGGGLTSTDDSEDLFLGKFGIAEPAITTIKDFANDQGRNVRITLSRSNLDDGTAAWPVTEYQAFRRILPVPSASMRGAQALPSGTWEFVASIPASNAGSYRMIAPTQADSTVANGMYRTKFFIRAATEDPSVFFDSPVDSGYSLDNLAPGIPTNFIYTAGTLAWDESAAADFDYFSVYGSNTDSFGAATLINYSVAPSKDVSTDIYNYYWVTATDFSGNEGKPAKVSPLTGTGGTPSQYALSVSAYPNPFNPETTVRYTVPSRGHVEIAVYDLRGERVATLVNRGQDAGAFTVRWSGRTDAGAPVSSGVYFARIVTPAGERSYKLVLLK
jgi:hypothetical protein